MTAATKQRHAFIAGRFDADRYAFACYIRDVVTRGRCQSFATTETYGSLKPLRRALGEDWIVTRRGEYVIGVKRKVYRRTRLNTLDRLSRVYSGRDEWRDLFVHRRTFVHRATGRPVLFVAAHAPSHVELGNNWRGGSQTDAHQAGVTRLGRAIARATDRRPTLAVVVSMDTNVDHKRPVWRDRMTAMLGLPSCWSDKQPPNGTHGGRLIDAVYANVPMGAAGISGAVRPPKVDHRAVVVAIELGEAA